MGLNDGWVFTLSRHMPGPWGDCHLQPNAATWNPVARKTKNPTQTQINRNVMLKFKEKRRITHQSANNLLNDLRFKGEYSIQGELKM